MTPTQATAAKQPTTASQHLNPKSDSEIPQSATKRLILDVARDKLGIGPEHLEPYGHYKAKVSMDFIKSLKSRPNGSHILVEGGHELVGGFDLVMLEGAEIDLALFGRILDPLGHFGDHGCQIAKRH